MRGQEFADVLSRHADEAQTRLAGTGKEIVLAIATQGARVNEALNRTAETLSTTVDSAAARWRSPRARASPPSRT